MFSGMSKIGEWGACSDDEVQPVEEVTSHAAEPDDDDGFQTVSKSSRSLRAAGPRPVSTILVFQDAFSNPTYEYTNLVVSHLNDLERLFSQHESRKCAKQGISYKYEFYHGYSIDSQMVFSYHHGKLRESKKLVGEELVQYEDKIKGCLKLYTKKTCKSCENDQLFDLANNLLLCCQCRSVRAKHKSKR